MVLVVFTNFAVLVVLIAARLVVLRYGALLVEFTCRAGVV